MKTHLKFDGYETTLCGRRVEVVTIAEWGYGTCATCNRAGADE